MVFKFFCIEIVTTLYHLVTRLVLRCHYIVTTLYNIVTTMSQGCDLVTKLLKHVRHLVHCKQPCHNLATSLLQLCYFYMGFTAKSICRYGEILVYISILAEKQTNYNTVTILLQCNDFVFMYSELEHIKSQKLATLYFAVVL